MKWYLPLAFIIASVYAGSSHNSIIPVDTGKDIEKGECSADDDKEVVRHSLAYCFKERYEGLESYVTPFMGARIQRLRNLFVSPEDTPSSQGSGSSSKGSGYGTPVCRSDSSSSVSLNTEVDNTIKEAVADTIKETFESYEKRMQELEHRVMVQNAVIDAQENSSTPRERKRALIITSCTALVSTAVTAIVTYYATTSS